GEGQAYVSLIERVIGNDWLLRRAEQQLQAMAAKPEDRQRCLHEKTRAEVSFYRALRALDQLRKRIAGTSARTTVKQDKEAAAPAPQKTPAGELFQSQNSPKRQRKIQILDQWVEITIENGKTVTRLFPSNEELIEEGKAMDPPPEMVYRRLNFVDGVPSEYHWATPSEERRGRGGMATQRMSVDTWLETIKREAAAGTGHIGPCGKLLPRPKERGGCECVVCSRLAVED
ncbi:MAG: hypothetical protein ACRD4O_17705, partial [Bryobacteraceae bacterium]